MQIIFVLAYAIFIYDLRLNNENLSLMTNKIKNFGGCACGKIRYKTLGYPTVSAVCHCRYCQLRSGSAFGVLVYFLEDNFEIIKGNTKRYSFISETGNKWVNNFCRACGTTLTSKLETRKGEVGISGGTFDPPTFWFDIRNEVFIRSKAHFISDINSRGKHNTIWYYSPKKEEPIGKKYK